jgi:hypothetical protein
MPGRHPGMVFGADHGQQFAEADLFFVAPEFVGEEC